MIRRPPRSTLFPYTTLFRSIGHLLCELFTRLRAVGLTKSYVCEFPITQGELGDALGLSTVHVNRSLQEDRKSTRLNSSHANISYAVFCLKKKTAVSVPTWFH